MYFLYVSNNSESIGVFEKTLHAVNPQRTLIAVPDAYELINFLQHIRRGETYPDLIILSTDTLRLDGRELLKLLKSDDIYCLIPVIMFLPELNVQDQEFCTTMGTDTILAPTGQRDWIQAAQKMCDACH